MNRVELKGYILEILNGYLVDMSSDHRIIEGIPAEKLDEVSEELLQRISEVIP